MTPDSNGLSLLHSPSSLRSQSPSYEDLEYERAHLAREAIRQSMRSQVGGKGGGGGGPSIHSGPTAGGGGEPYPFVFGSAYYDTYSVSPTINENSSAIYGRPPTTPKPAFIASTERFVPGKLTSALDQQPSK